MSKYIPTDEENKDIQEQIDPFYFENFCGSCIYYCTYECPFLNEVNSDSNSKECFYD